eukprot:TRINITY_DN4520_c0_g1_i1.p1 TRINITY_DN4520_c0_g1~~TRINITY_DN4520_c0_g1_i1.p1  ORF type:complete len:213 (-),score=38.70 TRINITY_DN4520_c0_g1_i1:322-960(-)
MAQSINRRPPHQTLLCSSSSPKRPYIPVEFCSLIYQNPNPRWKILHQKLKRRGRHSLFFSDNRKQEQAKKALESALGGKKTEFEKWNQEIKKREEVGSGGSDTGGGGWFGDGGWFGGSSGENFWKETQQASLAIVGIIFLYLVVAKGEAMLAVVFNSLLYVLRGVRNGFAFLSSSVSGKSSTLLSNPDPRVNEADLTGAFYKENVVRKWGSD